MAKHSARMARHPVSTIALIALVAAVAIAAGATLLISNGVEALGENKKVQTQARAIVEVDDELDPPQREVVVAAAPPVIPEAAPAPPETGSAPGSARAVEAPLAAAVAPPAAAPAPPAHNIDVYRGMGTWVDIYDYAIRDTMNIPEAVETMAERGVKTLYLQTSRWNDPDGIVNVAGVNSFLDESRARGIHVVGWYVPGFGDIDRDIQRSTLILEHASANGNKFDGLAPDIETRKEVGGDGDRYNAGVAEYSIRLRAALPNAVIGAIVDDAKNNTRAPERHAGFPWAEIASKYDVVLPMAYWSVTKPRNGGCGAQYDAEAYIREAVQLTLDQMGVDKPIHPIGGIADCVTEAETEGFVRAAKDVGIGGSYYDFVTIQSSSVPIWGHLASLN